MSFCAAFEIAVQSRVPPALIADVGRPFVQTEDTYHNEYHTKRVEIHGNRSDRRRLEPLHARVVNHR